MVSQLTRWHSTLHTQGKQGNKNTLGCSDHSSVCLLTTYSGNQRLTRRTFCLYTIPFVIIKIARQRQYPGDHFHALAEVSQVRMPAFHSHSTPFLQLQGPWWFSSPVRSSQVLYPCLHKPRESICWLISIINLTRFRITQKKNLRCAFEGALKVWVN